VAPAQAVGSSWRSSLALDPDNRGFTFVRTGGTLLPDACTLTLAGRTDALAYLPGRALDGNGDGIVGGDYGFTFRVAATAEPTLAIGEFAHGPRQLINLPAGSQNAGIPVHISNGAGVSSVEFSLKYNPALLTVQDVKLASSIAGSLVLKSIDGGAGLAQVRAASS